MLSPGAYPQVLQTFTVPAVVTVVLPHHHLDLGCIQGIHLPQFCHTVGCNNHTPLVHQSPAAHQLPVRSLIEVASSCSTVLLQGPCLAVCLGHLCLSSVGGATVDGCQPRPVSLRWPLWVKGGVLPTHCQRGGDRMRGQRERETVSIPSVVRESPFPSDSFHFKHAHKIDALKIVYQNAKQWHRWGNIKQPHNQVKCKGNPFSILDIIYFFIQCYYFYLKGFS